MAKKHRRPGQTILTRDEIDRAIFVDYEGSKHRSPTLLGYLIDNKIGAAIVEPRFHECRTRHGAKHAVNADHLEIVLKLIRRAKSEDRVIISWSEYDYDHMIKIMTGHETDIARLKHHFRNAIFTSRQWLKKAHPGEDIGNDLASMMKVTNYITPERFGVGLVGDALRLLRGQLAEGRVYPDLSDGARDGWRTVVKHNKHDLLGMQHVLRKIS